MNILLADDDNEIRSLIKFFLSRWGHTVFEAANGKEAWEIINNNYQINFVISDWMMPEMDGIELCKLIRQKKSDSYIYVLLNTSRNDQNDLIMGMEAGADDFMEKPVNKNKLRVKIRAGERLLDYQKKLQNAYQIIKNDIAAAAKIQEKLLPTSKVPYQGLEFNWLFKPATDAAGDIFNYFKIDDDHIGFYLLDVAGHGITAAMLSVTLSKTIYPYLLQSNVIKSYSQDGKVIINSPAKVLANLNAQFQNSEDSTQYFTIVYCIVSIKDKTLTLSRGGHPAPILLSENGNITFVGQNGFPVGMIQEMDYEEVTIPFNPGDSLFIYSDGVIECRNNENILFSINRLTQLITENYKVNNDEFYVTLLKVLSDWKTEDEFEDDISIFTAHWRKND